VHKIASYDKVGLEYLQITNTMTAPEVAFTGDTMSNFIVDENNADVLRAKILVVEVCYLSVLLNFCYISTDNLFFTMFDMLTFISTFSYSAPSLIIQCQWSMQEIMVTFTYLR